MSALENLVELVNFRLFQPYPVEDIKKALVLALSAFNMVPNITYFTFYDEEIIDQLKDILVTYACHIILMKNSPVERNKEFMQINDGGISYMPPSIAEHLAMLTRELWNNWDSQVRELKQSDSFYEDFVRE